MRDAVRSVTSRSEGVWRSDAVEIPRGGSTQTDERIAYAFLF